MTTLKEENAQCGDIAENSEITDLKGEKKIFIEKLIEVIIPSWLQNKNAWKSLKNYEVRV